MQRLISSIFIIGLFYMCSTTSQPVFFPTPKNVGGSLVDSIHTDSCLFEMSQAEIECILNEVGTWHIQRDSEPRNMLLVFRDTTDYRDELYWYFSEQKDSSFLRSGSLSGSGHMNWEIRMPDTLLLKDNYRMPDVGMFYKILRIEPKLLMVRYMPYYWQWKGSINRYRANAPKK